MKNCCRVCISDFFKVIVCQGLKGVPLSYINIKLTEHRAPNIERNVNCEVFCDGSIIAIWTKQRPHHVT